MKTVFKLSVPLFVEVSITYPFNPLSNQDV